jgi:hypothetical protein
METIPVIRQAVISCLWILFGIGFPQTVTADEDVEPALRKTYWSIQFENDFFTRSGDRYYTHGSQASGLVMGETPEWLDSIAQVIPGYESDGKIRGTNYTLGQQIFTPDDTVSTELVQNDRPYAGYYFFSVALLSRINHTDLFDTGNLLEFTLGVVGPASMGEDTQTSVHDLLDIESPRGWDNQLHNELGLGLSYSRMWKYVYPMSETLEFGLGPQLTASLGNVYTYAATGVMFRLGTQLRNDFAPPSVRPGFPGTPLFHTGSGYSWYLYAGFEGRLVGRNIFLDGNTFRDSHSVDKEQWVGDYQYGLVFRIKRVRIAFTNVYRTREYTTQQDNTQYGAVNVSFAI